MLSEIGSFGGLFRPDLAGLAEPVLVASADGVGTKLAVAQDGRRLLDRGPGSGQSLRQRHPGAGRRAVVLSRLRRRRSPRARADGGVGEGCRRRLHRERMRPARRRDRGDAGLLPARRLRAGGLHRRHGRSRPRCSTARGCGSATCWSGCRRRACTPTAIPSPGAFSSTSGAEAR